MFEFTMESPRERTGIMRRVMLCTFLVVTLATARFCEADKPKCPCDTTGQPVPATTQSELQAAPWVCPLWEVLQLGGGNLYYCERFTAEDCTDPPEVVYAFGVLAYPCYCSEGDSGCCFSTGHKAIPETKPFPGLRRLVRPTDQYELPSGRAREFAYSDTISGLEYVTCKVDSSTSFVARVFRLAIDKEGAASGFHTTSTENIYIAFETSHTQSSAEVNCTPVDPAYDGTYYVYRASHALTSTQKITILIFRAR